MEKIVGCVPNFSEGKSKQGIEAIARAISSARGCSLLAVDPEATRNRTVYTFVGSPDAVVKGALAGALVASSLIDMSKHTGAHPRIGVLDICPFVPVKGVTMEECIDCSNQFGKDLASTLKVPVYLYGRSSTRDYRHTAAQIRSGEYENLPAKLKDAAWAPDFGPAEFVPSWGATITGARGFLISYNINLLGTREQAHRIALNIREKGRDVDQPGRLKCVQAIGWYPNESDIAQISVNIADINVTPMHIVFDECVKDAKELNLSVVGSEVVGLMPKSCMLAAADFYIQRENLFVLEEAQKIRLAVNRLGLHSLKTFDPKKKIIEYMLDNQDESPLTNMNIVDFVNFLGSRPGFCVPVPGGGSVAALVGSLGTALGSMSALCSYGNRKFEKIDAHMRKLIPPIYESTQQLLPLVDADSLAYNEFKESSKQLSNTPQELKKNEEASKKALLNAIAIPVKVAQTVNSNWKGMLELAEVVNIACLSDVQVSVRCLQTAVWGAYYTVKINLLNMESEDHKLQLLTQIKEEVAIMEKYSKLVLSALDNRTQ